MLLAIDIGNTNIHFGLYAGGEWCCSWRARTVHQKMGDEYAVLLRNFFQESQLTFADISGVVMASVVPALTHTFIQMSRRYLRHDPLNIDSTTPLGLKILIDTPREAGPDRLCNAAAARSLFGGPAAVIDFGTSTNFDVINVDGDYIGGVIATGIGLTHDALVSRAARLTSVDLVPPPSVIGSNTIHAMQSGLFLGYVAMVEGLVSRIRKTLGKETRMIATGGLAPLIADQTDCIDQIEPNLTLEGMRIVWELNHRS